MNIQNSSTQLILGTQTMKPSRIRNTYTENDYNEACTVGNLIFNRKIALETGVNRLVLHGINETSAKDFIKIYASLCTGESFLRGTSVSAIKIFTQNITKEHGNNALFNVIRSVDGHIQEMRKHGSKMISMEKLLEQYKKLYNDKLSNL
jgi:hypothetical protein